MIDRFDGLTLISSFNNSILFSLSISIANGFSPRSLEDFLIGNGAFLGLTAKFMNELSLDIEELFLFFNTCNKWLPLTLYTLYLSIIQYNIRLTKLKPLHLEVFFFFFFYVSVVVGCVGTAKASLTDRMSKEASNSLFNSIFFKRSCSMLQWITWVYSKDLIFIITIWREFSCHFCTVSGKRALWNGFQGNASRDGWDLLWLNTTHIVGQRTFNTFAPP